MKSYPQSPRTLLATVLIGSGLAFISADNLHAQNRKTTAAPAVDPATHAAHVASGAMPPDAAKGDPALNQQLAQLQAKVAQLETALAKNAPRQTTTGAMPGMGGPPSGKGGGLPSGAGPAMAGMGGGAMPPAPSMATGGMAMGMDMMKMGGMMGMGGMGGAAPGAMPQSALPGFPGASHLYHLGSTGFFLDHTQHIALTTEQTAGLNKAKEQALLAKSTGDRAKEQAEQELWMLTAADQPDAAKIEAKLAEIGKLNADERLAFIRAVGEASKLLTDPQRQSLTGFAPPAPAAPAAAPMAGGMKDM